MAPQEAQVEQIALSIEEAQDKVAIRDSILRLEKNKDFKRVFEKLIFEKEPVRMVLTLGDDALKDKKEDIIADMEAIGRLHRMLRDMILIGNQAEMAITQHQEMLEEMQGEEDGYINE